jgi:hypothetical protein
MYNKKWEYLVFFVVVLTQDGCHRMRLKWGRIISIWLNMRIDGGKGLRVAGR